MITIVNITPEPKEYGPHEYSLRINQQEICKFWHLREAGLAACLAAAAKAAEVADEETRYKEAIPPCCSRTFQEHMDMLLCWGLLAAVRENEAMDCGMCEMRNDLCPQS